MTGSATRDDRGRTTGPWLLVSYFALLSFGLGVGLLESCLNDPIWRDLGARMSPEDFLLIRHRHARRIFPMLVIPLALRVPATLGLLWRRPEFVPRWTVLAAFGAQLVGWTSSGLIPIPIQSGLIALGPADGLFACLIATDSWSRVLPLACEVAAGMTVLRSLVAKLAAPSSIRPKAEPRPTMGRDLQPIVWFPMPPLPRGSFRGD